MWRSHCYPALHGGGDVGQFLTQSELLGTPRSLHYTLNHGSSPEKKIREEHLDIHSRHAR
jgi:hypothetical protein